MICARIRAALAVATSLLALQLSDVRAQDAPAPTAPAAASRGRVIEEIIVTAQKREENVHDVPISMSVLDGNFISENAVTDFKDIAELVPNARVDNNGEFNDVRIRGFGSPLSNKAFEQSVGLVIDGIPYGRREYFLGPLFDLERVEVLRGPQGTLFGKNTTAGLFNVITKKPTDEYTGFVQGEYGELDRAHFSAGIGGPLWRNWLNFRLSGLAEQRDGYMVNTTAPFSDAANPRASGRERKGIRAQLALPDLAGANIVLSYEHVDVDLDAGGWEFRILDERTKPFFRAYDPNADFVPFNYRGSVDQSLRLKQHFDTLVLNASYELRKWTLNLVGGYAMLDEKAKNADPDFTPAPIFFSSDKDENPQTTAELRATSPSLPGFLGLEHLFGRSLGTSDLTVGGFYQRREINNSARPIGINALVTAQFLACQGLPLNAVGGLPVVTIIPPGVIVPGCGVNIPKNARLFEETTGFFEQSGNAYAGFGQMNWHLLDRWTLQYGMRLTWEDKQATNRRITSAGTGVAFSALGIRPFTKSLSRDEFAFTPKVGLIYDWSDNLNLFATWARGFKSGGFNELASNADNLDNLQFKPEETTSWEVGSKMRLLDGAATANVSLYWQNATDLQVFTVQPSTAIVSVTNAGEARSRGVEADAAWLATDWLTIRGAMAFTDAKYLKFPFGDCTSDRPNTDGDGDPRCDLSGKPLYRTPKWTVTSGPSMRFPLASILGSERLPRFIAEVALVSALTVEYEDTQFVDRTDDPRTRQPSFFKLNGSVGFEDARRGWSLRFHAENITDEATVTQAREVTLGPGKFVQVLEAPRLVFGSFRWSF
jgi:outer membrane receptor protein involved in Fe transport